LAFPPRTVDTYLDCQFEHEVVDQLVTEDDSASSVAKMMVEG
jgi:hypothetical protein